jgi:hypothetical protein
VIRRQTIRVLIALAMVKGWSVEHYDVNAAYLKSPIREEVYVEQPSGFEKTKNCVYKLKKSMYGLHQSSKNWNICFDNVLKLIGLQRSVCEPCVYFDEQIIVGIYVDDIIAIGTTEKLALFKSRLSTHLDFKDLGQVKNILSMSVKITENAVYLDQSKYIEKLLKQYNLENSKGCVAPLDFGDKRVAGEADDCNQTLYQRAIGSLLYVSNNTRPDISFAVCKLSQYSQKPSVKDWQRVKKVLRYLKKTKNCKLCYKKKNSSLQIFCDADYANSEDRKSISGFVCKFAGSPILW